MAKLEKIEKAAKNAASVAETQQENGGIDFDHPSFAGLKETAKAFIRKNASNFAFVGGKWCVNPAFLMVAAYSEGSNETSPGYQASRSKDLKIRKWEETNSEGKTSEKTNENSSSRVNIAAYIHDINTVGYRHGEIGIRYVGGDKITPALWVEDGRHRTVAAKEGNLPWIPFNFTTDKVMASVQDLRSNRYRNNLTIAALAEQIFNLYGKNYEGKPLTVEKISEMTGIPVKDCTVYNTVMRDIIPEIREVASNETPNQKGKFLSFTTSLVKIAQALPASSSPEFARQQRELLASWFKGEIPDLEDYCKAIKRARKASEGPAPTPENNTAGENPGEVTRRRGRAESAIYAKLGGLSGVEWRHFAQGGIPSDTSLNSDEISQLMLAVFGYAELPEKLQNAVEVFDFAGYAKSNAKKEKVRVEGSASTQKRVELPPQLRNVSSYEDLQRVVREQEAAAAQKAQEVEEAPSLGENLDFLSSFGEDSPSGDSFQ